MRDSYAITLIYHGSPFARFRYKVTATRPKIIPITLEIYNEPRFTIINRLHRPRRAVSRSAALAGGIFFQIIILDRPLDVLAHANGGV